MANGRRRISVALIIAGVAAAVFVLPWVVPTPIRAVISDSQAVGFNNQVAMLGLAAGMVAMLWVSAGARSAGDPKGRRPLISLGRAPRDERVNPWVVRAGIALVVLMVVIVASVLRQNPYSDALYFTNVFLRVAGGGAPFTEIEFAYGPLQFLLPYGTWRALAWTGVSVYPVYYAWVAVFHSVGLGLAVFILNRLRMSHALRNGAFAFTVIVAVMQPTLSLSYTGVRFLMPYAALLWIIGNVTRMGERRLQHVLPLLAVLLTTGISPEMGVALTAALGVSLAWLAVRDSRRHLTTLLVLLVGMLVVMTVTWVLVGASTVGGFAGGAFYFPVLPSASVLLFVASALAVAWAAGGSLVATRSKIAAVHAGWLVLATVLIVPALGRADYSHVTWNSLGITLSCVAILGRRPWRAGAYIALATGTFAFAMIAGMNAVHLPALRDAALRSFVTSQDSGERVGEFLGDAPLAARGLWKSQSDLRDREHRAAVLLASLPDLAYPNFLSGEVGQRLVSAGDLVPMYVSHPEMAITRADYVRLATQLEGAQNIAIQTGQVEHFLDAAVGAVPDAQGIVMVTPDTVGGEAGARWDANLGYSLVLEGRYPVFDPTASFGLWLERGWVPYTTIGDYTVFRRR